MIEDATVLIRSLLIRVFSVVAVALLFCLSTSQLASAQEMKSIDEFLKQEAEMTFDKITPAQVEFIGLRCAALYTIMSQYGSDTGDAKNSAKFRKAAEDAIKISISANNNKNTDHIKTQITIMVTAYTDRLKKSKALTGSYFNDTIVSADLKLCGQVF